MYNSRKKPQLDIPIEITEIWACSNEHCKVWMRDNFTFNVAPFCTQCQCEMVKVKKEIGVLVNNSPIVTVKK